MIINGKDVEINYKKAEEIQKKVDKIEQIPDSAKVEVNNKELKELRSYESSLLSNLDGFGVSNNTWQNSPYTAETRKEQYITFQEMSETNFIHRGLQIIADDCTQRNDDGHTMNILSDDDDIKEVLSELFIDRLNIDRELWSIFYETCKLGDNFYEVIPDSYQKPTCIARIRYLEPHRVSRIEKNGKLAFYTYTSEVYTDDDLMMMGTDPNYKKKDDEKVVYKLEPWQIIHFKISDKDFYPYGGSLLKSGVKTFKRLQLLEDGMVIYRLARVPERRVFKIDCGNIPQSEANRQVQRIKDNYRTSQILDERGNINRTASALSLTQDIFVPMREGSRGTEISTLGPGTALNNIDDIRYFRDQILWTMNIPPEYLGSTSDQSGGSQGRGSLAMQDIKFSRFAERIQLSITEGLNKLAAIELFFKHKKKDDLKNFRIVLTPPSNIKEIMDIEFAKQKMELIQGMNGTGLFPKKYILEKVLRLSKKEIDNILFFKDLESQASNADQNALIAGMGAPGMGDMGGGMPTAGGDMGAPAPEATPAPAPAASIDTEGLEEKMVKLFGKDILIENKEDFVKIVKAAEEFNKSLAKKPIKEEKEVIKEDEDMTDSEFIECLSRLMGNNENVMKRNDDTISLIFENELGGLNFDERKFAVYEKPKKRTGPKSGSSRLLYEEKTLELR